jgi:hypothetical protein
MRPNVLGICRFGILPNSLLISHVVLICHHNQAPALRSSTYRPFAIYSSTKSIYFSSISQRDTWAPLSINQRMITLLADHFQLSSGFFQILRCFRNRTIGTEESFAGATRSVHNGGRSGRSQFEFLMSGIADDYKNLGGFTSTLRRKKSSRETHGESGIQVYITFLTANGARPSCSS